MIKSIYLSICLSVCSSVSLNGQVLNSHEIDKGTGIQRNALFNVDEIKVRWKKAALENCNGIPCVVTPPAPSFTCGTSTVSDVDGNAYNTKLIGSQCWTTTNLKVTKYNDGSVIGDSTNSTWGNSVIGARTGYVATGVSSSDYVGTFGYLYNWYAVNDLRKLCPAGWHVPTDSDWNKLVKFIDSGADTSFVNSQQGTTAGTKLKKKDALWTTNTGTDDYDFSVLPGGVRRDNGSFNDIRDYAFFWSATEVGFNLAWRRRLNFYDGTVVRDGSGKSVGASVRCLRD